MESKFKVLALVAITALSASMAFGQTIYTDVGTLSSNTSIATAGIFKNDVDNYMNYHKYSGVLKDDAKWFGFITGKTAAGGVLDIGYARNFGGIYLGTWYRGNIYRLGGTGVYETKTITPTYDDSLEILTQRVDTTAYTNARWDESTNNFEFLIGIAGMGIKVGFFESASSNKNEGPTGRNVVVTDYLDGRKDYANAIDEYSVSRSNLKPYLGWGATFGVAGMNLSPYVDLGLTIHGEKQIDNYSSYTEINGVKQNVVNTVGIGYNRGYLVPDVTVGAKIDLPKKETVQTTLELRYRLNLTLYGNDADKLGSVNGTVDWAAGQVDRVTEYTDRTVTTTNITYAINEQTNMTHVITPIYKITGEPAENFKLGFSASLPLTFYSLSSDQYTKQIQKDVTKYKWDRPGTVRDRETITYTANGNTETSEFRVNLGLALGASYQLIPGRFGINAGIGATPLNYTQTVNKRLPRSESIVATDKITQDDGSVTTNDKAVTLKAEADNVTVNEVWNQYTANVYGGFTFNFSPKAALDLGANSSTGSGNGFNLDLPTVNVIFTFKF
jgi:hypothetical protein